MTSTPGSSSTTAAGRWADALAAWAIPPEVLARADRSPWELPVQRFVGRADEALSAPRGWSYERAASALEPGSSVLDVGSGAGAASLPLVPRVGQDGLVTAVDSRPDMLEAFETLAAPLAARFHVVEGEWPQVASEVEVHDVVVAHHVVYNVADIAPFVAALTDHARLRVVVELPPRHPLSWFNPLWEQFWGNTRPTGPTSDDFVDVLREVGVRDLVVYRWTRADRDLTPLDVRAALVTQRLCLPPDRLADVRAAIEHLAPPQVRDVVTVAWSGAAGAE